MHLCRAGLAGARAGPEAGGQADAGHAHSRSRGKKAATPSRLSTLSGVYTDEQAGAARTSTREPAVPATRRRRTPGRRSRSGGAGSRCLIYSRSSANEMPKNDPGTLAPEDVADVVAYLLKMNAMPVGKNELYPDADSLKKFRIDVKPSGTSTATRKKP